MNNLEPPWSGSNKWKSVDAVLLSCGDSGGIWKKMCRLWDWQASLYTWIETLNNNGLKYIILIDLYAVNS